MKRQTLFFCAVLLVAFTARPVVGQDLGSVVDALQQSANQRAISVSGDGEVEVKPDQATVRFGVVTKADDPERARAQNAEASKRAMNAVRDLDVPERKVQLETLRLQPEYEYNDEHDGRELVGYEATRTVKVELDDLETLPTLVTRVVQEGANRLEGIEYGLQDRTEARNEALRKAMQQAKNKAKVMAEALDAKVGRVMRIDEQSFNMPRPQMRMNAEYAQSAAKASPEPEAYAAGQLKVHAVAQVTFSLQ